MKVYTKTGDLGTTSLFGGKRVDKNSARIKAYGEVDELNSQIGVIIAEFDGYSSSDPLVGGESRSSSRQARTIMNNKDIIKKLLRIQSELFVLGADLATPQGLESRVKSQESKSQRIKVPRVKKLFVTRLEREIDQWERKLPKLKNFILPGGSKVGSKLQLTRAITRRAERSIVALDRTDKINENVLIYVNRLSDWFFVAARLVNKLEGAKENLWKK